MINMNVQTIKTQSMSINIIIVKVNINAKTPKIHVKVINMCLITLILILQKFIRRWISLM